MRFLFSTTGGTGHLGPLVPFASACRRRGHDVMVMAPESFGAKVEEAGFAYRGFADPPPNHWAEVMGRMPRLTRDEANTMVICEVFAGMGARAALPGAQAAIEEWRPDLVVREHCELASGIAAERAGVPHMRVGTSLGGLETVLAFLAGPPLAPLRESVGLDADVDGEHLRDTPYLSLAPPALENPKVPGPAGALRYRDGAAPPPAAAVQNAQSSWGAREHTEWPLVYVTLGTVAANVPYFASVLDRLVDTLSKLPVRLLVTTGGSRDPESLRNHPENVRVERWVHEPAVLPDAALVVSHGGFGTVLRCLTAGVPLVVVPLFGDQPANAARVTAVGAGLDVDGGGGPPDADALRDAVSRVLDEPSFRQGAERIAADVRSLPTTDDAVDDLERS